MPASVRFQVDGWEKIAGKLRAELFRKPLERVVNDAGTAAQREAQQGARDLGGIARSFAMETRGLEARIVSRHPGALPHEFGRRPGGRMPPMRAFARYGAFAFVVARAIQRRGFKGRFFARHAVQVLRRHEVPRLLGRASEEIAAEWAR